MFESIIKNERTRQEIKWRLRIIRNYRNDWKDYNLPIEYAEKMRGELKGILEVLTYEGIITIEQFFILQDIEWYIFETKVQLRKKEEVKRQLIEVYQIKAKLLKEN